MKKYTEEQHRFIEANVKGMTLKNLVELVNSKFHTDFTEKRMKAYKKNHKLKSGISGGVPAGGPTELYPEEIQKFIELHYIGVGHKNMADLLNRNFGTSYIPEQMKAYYHNHKLNSGLDGRFLKGQEPFNKGTHIGGWEPTQFKKGNIPHNWLPVGSERINRDGYFEIKIADPRAWKGKHILIWEEHNGTVPKGYAVIFGDGDRSNFDIDNLILVSRPQLALLNRYRLIKKDATLTRTGVIIADLHLKISDRRRKAGRSL